MNVSGVKRKKKRKKERETERIEGHFIFKQKKSCCGHNDGIVLWTTTMIATRVKLEEKKKEEKVTDVGQCEILVWNTCRKHTERERHATVWTMDYVECVCERKKIKRTKEEMYAMFGVSKPFMNNKTKREARNEKWQRKAIYSLTFGMRSAKFHFRQHQRKKKKNKILFSLHVWISSINSIYNGCEYFCAAKSCVLSTNFSLNFSILHTVHSLQFGFK